MNWWQWCILNEGHEELHLYNCVLYTKTKPSNQGWIHIFVPVGCLIGWVPRQNLFDPDQAATATVRVSLLAHCFYEDRPPGLERFWCGPSKISSTTACWITRNWTSRFFFFLRGCWCRPHNLMEFWRRIDLRTYTVKEHVWYKMRFLCDMQTRNDMEWPQNHGVNNLI